MIQRKVQLRLYMAILLFGLLSLSGYQKESGKQAFRFFIQDSISIDVLEIRDQYQSLQGYYSQVFTPICEDWECYDVELDFYWDVTGVFQKYDTISGKPLTKKEHDPFTKSDYTKLKQILHNPAPAFAYLQKEEIVQKVVVDSLDGITGATIASIRDEIVPGAALSCYTLWHIAHGVVVDSIQAYTCTNLEQHLVQRFITSENKIEHFFLVDCLSPEDYQTYIQGVLSLIAKEKGYFARYTIEKMPDEIFYADNYQAFFAALLPELSYFGQLSLIQRFENAMLSDELAQAAINIIDQRDSELNQKAIELIITNYKQLPVTTLAYFINYLVHTAIPLSKKQQQEIYQWENLDAMQEHIKVFKKNYKIKKGR